ncbi:MAG: protein phosphatase CheZ [Alphaproteobacteria bacterium]|nr:protein phosphatase CheZ [Alphaproteobacteria bacterium]
MAKGKLFRIEQSRVPVGKSVKSGDAPVNGRELEEIRESIEALRKDVQSLSVGEKAKPATPAGVDAETFKQQIVEAERLKFDLQELSDAIERTKQEIATLRSADPTNDKIATASEALRAVVGDTEYATNGIINAAEAIEDVAGRLRAELSADSQTQVDELFEHATAIFEACNFQDITGQRITKVVNTMEFIDERVRKMMDIWGGDSAFASVMRGEEKAPPKAGEELHGPAMEGDGSISQDEIDALFD